MFFTHIDQLMTPGVDLTLVIRKSDSGSLTVSALPKASGLKDGAQHHLIPLTLTGTPTELDGEFMSVICQPVNIAAGLLTNMSQFEQAADKAAANSKAAKDKKANESRKAKEKREKYERFMKKADELISGKKYREGLTELQQAFLCAQEQDKKTVSDKISEVKMKLAQGFLFDMNETEARPVPQTPQTAPVINTPPVHSQPAGYPVQPVQPQMSSPQAQQYPQNQAQMSQLPPVMSPQPAQNSHIQQVNQQPKAQPAYQPQYQIPVAQGGYDPDSCRPGEYSQYPDFPGYGNDNMFNNTNQF